MPALKDGLTSFHVAQPVYRLGRKVVLSLTDVCRGLTQRDDMP